VRFVNRFANLGGNSVDIGPLLILPLLRFNACQSGLAGLLSMVEGGLDL